MLRALFHQQKFHQIKLHQIKEGFTLIELLVVIVILSLFTSSVFLTVNTNQGDEIKSQYQRLSQLMQLAQDEAIIKGKMVGLHFEENGYFFSEYKFSEYQHSDNQQPQWQLIFQDSLFSPHQLNSGLLISLEIEGELVPLDHRDEEQTIELNKENFPPIIFLPSGELTSFKLSLSTKEISNHYQAEITGHESGQIDFIFNQNES